MAKLNLPKQRTTEFFANPLKRIAAFFIDLLILDFVVASAFSSYFTRVLPSKGYFDAYAYVSANPEIISQIYSALVAMSLLMILYFAYMEHKYNQTVGKMLFHIYVRPKQGKKITFWQSALRSIFLMPVFPIFLLWIVDPVLMLIKGERFSEIISKTQTVEEYPI
ncbi:RDD family protein [Candidatus Woesearchaeota archaeon]|nr:RDD family protein [Candidatus Woesearchaeota archaeon]